MPGSLYRCFDENGALLYVGISKSALARVSAHSVESAWYPSVAKISIENFDSVSAAANAEKLAIATENPLHNKQRYRFADGKLVGAKHGVPPVPKGNGRVTGNKLAGAIIAKIKSDGKTVQSVCQEAGISRQQFYNVISGHQKPRLNTIKAIAKATGLTPLQIRPELAE